MRGEIYCFLQINILHRLFHYAPVPPKDPVWDPYSCTVGRKKAKMGGNTGSVLKSGIKNRSSPGRLRSPQAAPDSPDWSGTKNRLSQFSGRFQPRSCRTHTDWVPGHLRPPGINYRRPQASSGLLSLPQTRIPDSCFPKLLDFLGIYI